mmetsp:Transcript_24229/g.34712  ORF Transcript_24229/g.34712 Transcript_24229/m.34712 type:complete len:85 (-) Transcript_24229:68-322(-)
MWIKQVLQQERLTDIARQKAFMEVGSLERFLHPRNRIPVRQVGVAAQWLPRQVNAVARLSRWWCKLVRFRSKVELPRMGIGDPG